MDNEKVRDMVERFFNNRLGFEKFLGEGSFANVYLLKHKFLNQKRAMKLIKESLTQSSSTDKAFKEARIATKLRHENIINIYDAGIIQTYGIDEDGHFILESDENKPHDNWGYFIMEYVSGGDLEDYRQSFNNSDIGIPLLQVLTIIKQILMGLNVLHTSTPQIIHRDLKTENILMGFDHNGHLQVKIADFGLAKEVSSDISADSFGGTRLYMSPESFHNIYSTNSDVYAVGVIFYLLLTNHYPRIITEATDDVIPDESVWTHEVKKPSYYNTGIDTSIDEIVLKAIAIDAKDRYHDAGEFLEKIEEVIADTPLEDNPFFDTRTTQASSKFNQYNRLNINEKIEEAFKLAQTPDMLEEAIEILEKEILKDETTRRNYTQVLRMWKSKHPDRKLISEAYQMTLRAQNYKLASTFIREAIAINPSLAYQYESTVKIWDILSNLERDENLIEAVDNLEESMIDDEEINAEYRDLIDTLKSYSVDLIVEEALHLANDGRQLEASRLMEFVVSKDKEYKTLYADDIEKWKLEL